MEPFIDDYGDFWLVWDVDPLEDDDAIIIGKFFDAESAKEFAKYVAESAKAVLDERS